MRLLVVNCNTSSAMTAGLAAAARSAARPGTEIIAIEPQWGPESAEGYYDSFLTAAAVLERLASWDEADVDAVVMAGFGEHGREGARQLLAVPVVDITEAATQLACLVGHRFGVVTTVSEAVAPIEDSMRTTGLLGRCAGVRASDLEVLSIHDEASATEAALEDEARALLAAGADVIVLGCAGMSAFAGPLAKRLGVPVIDGLSAAVKLGEALVDLGLRTSKVGPYRPPRVKDRVARR